MPLQTITSGIFQFQKASANRGNASASGNIFLSIDDDTNITGDIRIHDAIRKGGISTPPPGTVSYMLPRKNNVNPMISPAVGDGFDVREGWLFCDGSILDKDEYGALYYAIGDYWNTDPSVTSNQFQIPDFRGYYIRCYKNGPFGAASRQEDSVEKHSHYMILNPSGQHTHQYINWDENSFINPTAGAPLGVRPETGDPGDGTRAVYAVSNYPTVAGDTTTIPYMIGGGNESFDLNSFNNSFGADFNFSSSPSYVVLGEGYTRKMGTYDSSGNFQQESQLHKHYIRTKNSVPLNTSNNPASNNPDVEGDCIHIKIPTFIKY